MPKIDNEIFYTSAISQYGITPRGVNWLSQNSQELRFEVLLSMLPKDLTQYTLADAGCGFGDLYLYMKKNTTLPKDYIGIDILEQMCTIAKQQTQGEIYNLDICKEELPNADFYVCSGAMNVLKSFETHLFISKCFQSCKYGFVFNVLHGNKESQTYNYITTQEIQTIAKELKVSSLLIRDDYLQNDITVAFFKGSV